MEPNGKWRSCRPPGIFAISKSGKVCTYEPEARVTGTRYAITKDPHTGDLNAVHIPSHDTQSVGYQSHFASCPQAKQWKGTSKR